MLYGVKTKVKDLIVSAVCVDVYEVIADCIGVAFDGDGENPLTEKGMKRFSKVLNMDVYVGRDIAVIDTETYFNQKGINVSGFDFETPETTPKLVNDLVDLFMSIAGYTDNKDGYFKE